jgi:hypothetical protein
LSAAIIWLEVSSDRYLLVACISSVAAVFSESHPNATASGSIFRLVPVDGTSPESHALTR